MSYPSPPGYPPGYPPPYPPRYPYYAGYPPQPPRPQRSPAPRVVGILGIIFSVFGAGAAVLVTLGPMDDIDRWEVASQMRGLVNWIWAALALSALVFVAHLTASIFAVAYRPLAPRAITAYAVLSLLLAAADIILSLALVPDHIEFHSRWLDESAVKTSMVIRAVFAAIGIPWPVIALLLMNGRGAKDACKAA